MMEEYNINQTTLKVLGLYTRNYRRSLHLRAIARETDVDVKTIQIQLRRLESINVVSSSVKGKNKEYSLNLGNQITKYYMILGETFASLVFVAKHFVIKKIQGEIADKIIGTVILFGSFAKGQTRKDSDVDLLVLSGKRIDRNMIGEAGSLVDRKISVKLMRREQFAEGLGRNNPLVREVVQNHVVLSGVDDLCDILWRFYARQ